MKRKEVYATTGPRILVRFWGGWNFVEVDAKGVPMGGDLSGAETGKSPTFLIAALKDPYGASLVHTMTHKRGDECHSFQKTIYPLRELL